MRKVAVIVLALSIAGCARVPNVNMVEAAGAAGGAALGGIVGYQFGGGLGQLLYTAGGAIVGGATGYAATRALVSSDLVLYENTAQTGLAEASDGEISGWSNPETGNSGIFRPVRSFFARDGRYCRQYRTSVAFGDGTQSGDGIACQLADGRWQVVSDHLG